MHSLLFLTLVCESRCFYFPGCEYASFQEHILKKWRPYFGGMGTHFHTPQEVICISTKWVKETIIWFGSTSHSLLTTLKECRRWKVHSHHEPVPVHWSHVSWPTLGEVLQNRLRSTSIRFQGNIFLPLNHSPDLIMTPIQFHGLAFSMNH